MADLIDDPRFRTNADRLTNIEALDAIIQDYVGRYTVDEGLAYFRQQGVTIGPVYNVAELMQDDHVVEREILVVVPDQQTHSIPMHNIVPRLSATPGQLRRPAPELGEHTAEVLSTINIDGSKLSMLKQQGVI